MSAHTLAELLGWPLLHFIWQGALIASVSAILLALCRNARPQLRYLIACLAMLLCLLWPALGVFQQWQSPQAMSLEAALQLAANSALPLDLVWVRESALAAHIENYLPLIVAIWSAGVALMLARLGLGLLWVYRLGKHQPQPQQDCLLQARQWQARTSQMAQQFAIGRRVQLQFQQQLVSPITYGCFRPVILMPASLLSGMPYDMIEALLAHELGHIKRWDYLVNLLQNLVLAMLFYHPAVWWLSKRINAERELIADDLAISAVGQSRPLARALQWLDKLQIAALPVPAMAAHGGDLLSRIKRLIRPDAQPWHWKMAVPVLGIGMALVLLLQTQLISRAEALPQTAGNDQPATQMATQVTTPAAQAASPHRTAYVQTQSEHVLVMDEQSGKILLSKNADSMVPIASLSKLMTAMLTLDAGLDTNEAITISKEDMLVVQNSQVKLAPGMVLSRQNLLELALIPSSNTAAKALARTYPGGEAAFATALQQKIASLKLQQTHLEEATGTSSKNRASASDLARIVKEAAGYPELRRLTSSSQGAITIAGKTQEYQSTNPLTSNKDWGISLSKTGYSKAAGRCLVMRTSVAGKPVIMVLLNAKNVDIRNDDVHHIRAMLDPAPSS
ncbi:M56 family metallopeptidase [Undibacterium sp. Ji50W]|uniref:M56 family metallopeptidase n=1 Tax=Undibacterium sp. Ji50W TaxID=3413041 RepID=UPI003BF45BF4